MHTQRICLAALAVTAALLQSGAPCRADDAAGARVFTNTLATVRESLGIEDVTVRVSAAGYMVDFRYRVLDSAKAEPLASRASKAHLIDQATKAKMLVPTTPKVGSLRQTAAKPEVGRVYGALFANPRQVVKSGSLVTVVVGDYRIENLVVQ